MASNASTPEPEGSGCCPCSSTSSLNQNCTPTPWEPSAIGETSGGTIVNAKLDQTLYFNYYSQNKTVCGQCQNVPGRRNEFSMGLVRLGGQEAAYFCYPDGWKPGGVGGVFSILPHVNTFNVPTPSYRRVYSEEGTLAFDGSDVPQAELPISAKRDTTYFTTYDERSGVYFEYFAGSGLSSSDARYGRVNRRYDRQGDVLRYDYGISHNPQGRALLRAIYGPPTGDQVIGGRVVPYFYYADENIDPATNKWAPVTKIRVLDFNNEAKSRTTYFDYTDYTDVVTGKTYPYLTRVVNPEGCVTQYDPIVPFNDTTDVNQIKRDVDPEGYQTYFSYTAGSLNRTTEPEGRITYYEYSTAKETKKTFLGRPSSYTAYSTAAGGGEMPLVTRTMDELGNSSYFTYDATLARITKEIRPNGNVTYYEYVGGTAANKYALRKKIQAANAAETYYGYDGEKYDLAKEVGPRHTATFKQTTYYRYDQYRSRISKVDALGYETLYGRNDAGKLIREQDARGNTAYFNYSLITGNLDSQTDAEGDATYFGYNAFRNLTSQVSPRFPEAGMQAFTTYYEYDQRGRRTKAIDPLQNVTYFDWSSRGDLLATVDARGTEREYTYNGLRLMTRETVTSGSGTALADTQHGYDIYKNRTQTQDGLGNTTYFFYDAIDRPIAQRDALGQTTYFQYDKVGSRTAVRDARNVSTYYQYDLLSRQTAMRDALGNSIYFGYDLSDNRTALLDARLNATYYFYDELDRLQATRDALLNPTYFYFDEVGNRKAVKDARFNATYYFYDRANRASSTRDALGGLTYFTYDRAGNVTRTTDARGNSNSAIFDALDRQTVAVDGVGVGTLIGFDQVGNRTAVYRGCYGYGIQPYGTSPYGGGDGVATYFSYDGLNRNTAVRDALGNQTYFFYDLVSNRTAVRNPLLHTTYFGYDALQRMTRAMDPLLKTTYFEFDEVSNQTRVIDPNTRQTMTRYDLLNRPDAVRFPDTGSAYFFYDEVGNRTVDLDPRLNATYYRYDELNRATRLADALLRTVYFEYDPVSNLSREIGAEAEQTAYTYDALNRRTNIAYTPAGTVSSASLLSNPYFIYDAVGNLTQMGDLWGLHRMAYDGANRLATHQYPQASVVYYEYDRRSNVTGTVYPGSAGVARAVYDTIDRQTKLQAPSGATAYFSYDAASNLTQKLLGNGLRYDMTYDVAERAERWRASKSSGTPLTYFDYTRDNKGLVTKAAREANYVTYYGYDDNDRLLHEIWAQASGSPTEVYGYRYAYDLAGNRTKSKVNGTDTYYFYDRANQLTVKGTNAAFGTPTYYTYDRNGSLTDLVEAGGTTKFAYNTAGLVARMRWRDASSTYFFYDGALRRYAMIPAGTNSATYFLWEGMNLLQERNADGSVKEEHTNWKSPIGGIAQLVETYRPAESASLQKIYPVMDWRGTITKWLQSDGSTVLASREYDAFGGLIPGSASGTWPGRFGYQGQAWIEIGSADAVQRLLLSPTRVYEPGVGIFVQKDPLQRLFSKSGLLRESIGFYTFSYVEQKPLQLIDVLGLWGSEQPGLLTRHECQEACDHSKGCSKCQNATEQSCMVSWNDRPQENVALSSLGYNYLLSSPETMAAPPLCTCLCRPPEPEVPCVPNPFILLGLGPGSPPVWFTSCKGRCGFHPRCNGQTCTRRFSWACIPVGGLFEKAPRTLKTGWFKIGSVSDSCP